MPIRFLLSINSLSLEIRHIPNASFPRARIEPLPKIEYSNNGSTILDGPIFAPKFSWPITAFLTANERDILEAIYVESDGLRRNFQPVGIDLSDFTLPYIESPPRSKPLASGSEQVIGNSIKYFAVFKTWMVEPPKFEVQGRLNIASFTLQEAE